MKGFLQDQVALMWVEYICMNNRSRDSLHDYIVDQDFVVFDTQYMFLREPTELSKERFDITKNITLTTGDRAWFGYKKHPWVNYREEIEFYAREMKLLQTDLCCINKRYLGDFLKSLSYL